MVKTGVLPYHICTKKIGEPNCQYIDSNSRHKNHDVKKARNKFTTYSEMPSDRNNSMTNRTHQHEPGPHTELIKR